MNASLSQELVRLINLSPSASHAVATMATLLLEQGFTLLPETEPWNWQPGGRYVVIRDGVALAALILPRNGAPLAIRLACSHTDSPGLKIKPNPLKKKRGYWVFDTTIYGSPILATWFDRDLSLAGMVVGMDAWGKPQHHLLDCRMPLARVANLAIHLNRGLNDGYKINPHDEMSPIWRRLEEGEEEIKEPKALFQAFLRHHLQANGHMLADDWHPLAWDLIFYDTQPAAIMGANSEWVAGARLDNLASCFLSTLSLLQAKPPDNTLAMLACFDHEEVGSVSTTGAAGNLVESILARWLPDEGERRRMLHNGWMLSVDNAHGCHPNYASQQDDNHCPMINDGVVLKTNANQRYATSALSGAYVKGLAQSSGALIQEFAVRADMACGSTVGPTLSSRLGIKTADIGIPTWAMHSIREVAGVSDIQQLHTLLTAFFGDG